MFASRPCFGCHNRLARLLTNSEDNLWIQTLRKVLNFQQSSVKLRLENSSCWQNVFLLKSPICSHLFVKNEDKFNFQQIFWRKTWFLPNIKSEIADLSDNSALSTFPLIWRIRKQKADFLFSESKLLSSDHWCLPGFHEEVCKLCLTGKTISATIRCLTTKMFTWFWWRFCANSSDVGDVVFLCHLSSEKTD